MEASMVSTRLPATGELTVSPARTSPWRVMLPYLTLGLLILFQYGMFRQYAKREVTWCFPLGCDQSLFLGRSYACYETILRDGLAAGLRYVVKHPAPNGLLLEAEAGLFYLMAGPSRLSALTINFAHFALFQLVLAGTLRWRTGRWGPALLGVGLLLSAATPSYPYGGMADFRLDFVALCVYGVFICIVLRSGVFLSWRWSLVVGGAAAWLVLMRHLTAVYLAIGCAGFLAFLGLGLLFRRQCGVREMMRHRFVGLLIAGITAAALAGPIVLLKWPVIRGYYLGHIDTSENQIRGAEFGASNLAERFIFYLKSLAFDHAGLGLLILSIICLIVTSAGVLMTRKWRDSEIPRGVQAYVPLALAFVFVALCVLAPLAALTVFDSPTPVAANIMVGPLVLLALTPLLAQPQLGRLESRLVAALAISTVAFGSYNQLRWMTRPLTPHALRAEYARVSTLYERIGELSDRYGWTVPRVAITSIDNCLIGTLITPLVYERNRTLLEPQFTLGPTVVAVSQEQAVQGVLASDIVVMPLTDKAPSIYPFVRCMRSYRSHLLSICRENFVESGRFHLPVGEVAVFVRPTMAVENAEDGGWITDAGLTLIGDPVTLKSRPRVEVCGPYSVALLPRPPAAQAQLTVADHERVPVPVHISCSDTEYRLVIDVAPDNVPQAPEVRIHLDFDTYFVPAERPDLFGASSDNRRLILRKPQTITLLPNH
jgi:hypothetical protein